MKTEKGVGGIDPKLTLLTVDNDFRIVNRASHTSACTRKLSPPGNQRAAQPGPRLGEKIQPREVILPSPLSPSSSSLLARLLLSLLTDGVFTGCNEVPAASNNNRTLPGLRHIMCSPSSFSLEWNAYKCVSPQFPSLYCDKWSSYLIGLNASLCLL